MDRRDGGVNFGAGMFGSMPRRYDPNAARQQRRSTLVSSVDDIRRAITLCLNEDRPCILEQADDIILDRGIVVPGTLPAFSLDGGDRFRLIVPRDMDFVFKMTGALGDGGCPTELQALNILLRGGVTVDTAFLVEQSAVLTTLQDVTTRLSRVRIDGNAGAITNLFGMGGADLGRIVVDGLTAFGVANVFAAGSNLTAWTWCRLTDLVIGGQGLSAATWGLGSTSPSFIECVFQRIAGSINVDTGSFSTRNFWSVVAGDGTNIFKTNNPTGGRPQTLLRVDGFSTRTLSPDDVDLD